ncbi:hypothetical protein BD414DRAFT_18908 [Trametes punicea]|nr:hypothetical protein BD414DRAFT_18908 [Trametes punicea]
MITPRAAPDSALSSSLPDSQFAEDPPTTMNMFSSRIEASNNVRSPMRTILAFSLVLVPTAVVPFILVRRHLRCLDTRLTSLSKLNAGLVRELKAVRADMAKSTQDAVDRSEAALQKTGEAFADLTRRVQRELDDVRQHVSNEVSREGEKLSISLAAARRVAEERDASRKAWEDEIRGSMNVLLNENLARRKQFAAELKELGQSLADTAAFIQEVEMRQGWTPRREDGRGIERTRRLAKRLQEFAATMETEATSLPEDTGYSGRKKDKQDECDTQAQ